MESWTTVRIRPKCEHNEPSFGHTWRWNRKIFWAPLGIYIGWYNKADNVFLRNENKHLFHLFLTYDTFYYDFSCHGMNRSKDIEMENSRNDSYEVNNFFSGNCMREMYTMSKEQWKMKIFHEFKFFVIIFFLKKIEVHFHNLVFLIHVTNYTRLVSDLDENYQNYLSLILFVLRSWTHTRCLFYVGKADTIYQYTRHNLIFSSFNCHNIRFIIYVCMNNENNYE